jgi:hypothetical protein
MLCQDTLDRWSEGLGALKLGIAKVIVKLTAIYTISIETESLPLDCDTASEVFAASLATCAYHGPRNSGRWSNPWI